jgi:hypothetical protein
MTWRRLPSASSEDAAILHVEGDKTGALGDGSVCCELTVNCAGEVRQDDLAGILPTGD